jgi:hypothetical protein
MEQLTIPDFNRPNSVTLKDVIEYMAMSSEDVEYEEPSNKEIRLAIDLAKQMNPLFKFDVKEQVDLIRKICKYENLSEKKILNVKSFKEILFQEVISSVRYIGDGKYKVKLIRVRRH